MHARSARFSSCHLGWLAALAGVLAWAPKARAEVEFNYRGYIESDLRFAVPGKKDPTGVDGFRFIRSENWANTSVSVGYGSVRAVGDLSLVYTGFPDTDGLADLVQRHRVDPFRVESNALFVEITDFIVEGLELRVGRQIVQWGTADFFNPTNNLNPYDLEDRLKFGEQVANEMLFLNYRIPLEVDGDEEPILDDVNITAVVVPFFRPPLLPGFGVAAFEDPTAFGRLVNSRTLGSLLTLQPAFQAAGGQLDYDVRVQQPNADFVNMQYATRLSWVLMGIDMSVSYFYGFDDVPRAERIAATGLPFEVNADNIDSVLELVRQLDLSGTRVGTAVDVTFPRMHVLGADFATSLDFLGGLGLWGELAVVFHDDMFRYVQIGNTTVLERDLRAEAFYKWTLGMDYSLTSWWYVNAQWVRGFIDEFGGPNLDDYLVAGSDFNLFANQLQIRLFAILNFQDLSYIIFPQLTFRFWPNTQLVAGAFLYGGAPDTKFGSSMTGPSTVFLRARYSF